MANEQMQRARELIKAKRYDEARAILRGVDSPLAQDWLERIDQLDTSAKDDRPDWLASVGGAEINNSDQSVRDMREALEANPVIQPDEPAMLASLIPAIIGGLVGALIGAAIWAAVAVITEYETSIVAIGVGFLAGGGVLVGAGGRRGLIFQMVAAVLAVVGIFIGKYLLFYHFLTQGIITEYGQGFFDALGLTFFSSEMIEEFFASLSLMFEGIDLMFIGVAVLMAFGMPSLKSPQEVVKPTQGEVSSFDS